MTDIFLKAPSPDNSVYGFRVTDVCFDSSGVRFIATHVFSMTNESPFEAEEVDCGWMFVPYSNISYMSLSNA